MNVGLRRRLTLLIGQGGAHEEDPRARDPRSHRSNFFRPRGAEACAEYVWLCYGGLQRRRRLLSGHRKHS